MGVISLGISCNHDAGVTVLDGDTIVFAANEERYTRRKLQFGFPLHSLKEALTFANGTEFDRITLDGRMQTPHPSRPNMVVTDPNWMNNLAEVDVLARAMFGTQSGLMLSRLLLRGLTQPYRSRYRRQVRSLGIGGSIGYAEHHQAHAASSSLLFGSANGLAVTVDAFGEGICAGTWELRDGMPVKRHVVPGFHSVGMLYLYVTLLLGFKIGQEGKVTGLAAHGDGSEVCRLLLSRLSYDSAKRRFSNVGLGYGRTALRRLERDLLGYSQEDIAAGVQKALETLVLDYVRDAMDDLRLSQPVVYLAGGVFANVSLNRRIAEELPVETVAVTPNMGDGGLSLGAALLNHDQRVSFSTLYLGTDLDSTKSVVPVDLSSRIRAFDLDDLPGEVAQRLARGDVIAVARGRMEFGPRALGNRSILAAALDKGVNDSLNKRLKRTEFMPFAPIVRDVDADRYFELTQPHWVYENMTITCQVREVTRMESPAIVHVDGTARPQILTRSRNPFVYDILTAYSQLTGIGVLVNTSFNMHEEPIVRDAETAIRSFLAGQLDAMVLGDQMVTPAATG